MLVPGAPDAPAPPSPLSAPSLGMPTDWTPARPKGLATATVVLTGFYALLGLVVGLMSQSAVDSLRESDASGTATGSPATAGTAVLSFVVGVASFVVLALWMSRIRKNLLARGVKAGGPPAVEWWGWFVPLGNFVLPFLGMKAIASHKVGVGVLLGWWIPFCLVWLLQGASTVISFTAFDLSTGDFRDSAALDAMVPLGYAGGVFIVISWGFLMTIIRRVTDRHVEDKRGA